MGILIFTILAVVFGIGSKARKGRKQAEFPFEPAETVSDPFWEVPEDSLETIDAEDTEFFMESRERPEPEPEKTAEPKELKKEKAKDFSLREAVIAQTVLERKFH